MAKDSVPGNEMESQLDGVIAEMLSEGDTLSRIKFYEGVPVDGTTLKVVQGTKCRFSNL